MPKYEITADSHLVLDQDDRGNVTNKERLSRGDTVEMSEADAERLVKTGGLRLASDAEPREGSSGTPDYEPGQNGATGGAGDAAARTTGTPASDDDETGNDSSDKYDSMSYSELQAEAKSRDLSAGGSTEDLQARLREDDES